MRQVNERLQLLQMLVLPLALYHCPGSQFFDQGPDQGGILEHFGIKKPQVF